MICGRSDIVLSALLITSLIISNLVAISITERREYIPWSLSGWNFLIFQGLYFNKMFHITIYIRSLQSSPELVSWYLLSAVWVAVSAVSPVCTTRTDWLLAGVRRSPEISSTGHTSLRPRPEVRSTLRLTLQFLRSSQDLVRDVSNWFRTIWTNLKTLFFISLLSITHLCFELQLREIFVRNGNIFWV